MADDRDYAGMYEIEPGVFAKRVHVYENDPMWLAMRQDQQEMLDLLTVISIRLGNIQSLALAQLQQLQAGVPTKSVVTNIVNVPLPSLQAIP